MTHISKKNLKCWKTKKGTDRRKQRKIVKVEKPKILEGKDVDGRKIKLLEWLKKDIKVNGRNTRKK